MVFQPRLCHPCCQRQALNQNPWRKNQQAGRISSVFRDPVHLIRQPGHDVIGSLVSLPQEGASPLADLAFRLLIPQVAVRLERTVTDGSCLLRNVLCLGWSSFSLLDVHHPPTVLKSRYSPVFLLSQLITAGVTWRRAASPLPAPKLWPDCTSREFGEV